MTVPRDERAAPDEDVDTSEAGSGSVTEAVAALMTLAAPTSVADLGSEEATWLSAFRAAGIHDLLLVRQPSDPALADANVPTLAHDLRLPLRLDLRFDLAIAIGAGDQLPSTSAAVFVRTLCDAAEVVAFAAALPGLAPPGTGNARWPPWWDSIFEERGYVPYDIARPLLWEEESVELRIRQGLVLYAPHGRFTAVPLPARLQRSIVHPETYHAALRRLEARLTSEQAQSARLQDEKRRVEEDLEAQRADRDRQSEIAMADGESRYALLRGENVLLRAALAATELELATTPSPTQLTVAAGRGPMSSLVQALTAAFPVRSRFRRIIGPAAPLWDEAWYISKSPDVLEGRLSPLWHYRRYGARLRRSPHPWFDPEWYAARNPAVLARGHDPVEHYLRVGWREGRDPHPLFATSWYGRHHASKDRWRRSPLEHYLERGAGDGLSPHPLLDARWYLECNSDVRSAGDNAIDHFARRGWREGRSPHPLFDVRWYLESNPDVVGAGVNPLVHYLRFGWREGRDPHPLFDTSWYLGANPDVREADLEPLSHYLAVGAAQGLATGPFDTSWYVEQHPEAAADGQNPLVFFVQTGRDRGDLPSVALGRGSRDARPAMSPAVQLRSSPERGG